MKKLFLLSMLLLTGTCIIAQITPSDSSAIIEHLQYGYSIANAIRPQPWFKGVPNEVISGIVTAISSLILGLLARKREKKKIKKSISNEINSTDSDTTTIQKIKGIVENKF